MRRVFVMVFTTTKECTLGEFGGCVIVVIVVTDDGVDELNGLTVVVEIDGEGGRGDRESVLGRGAEGDESKAGQNGVEKADASHGCYYYCWTRLRK